MFDIFFNFIVFGYFEISNNYITIENRYREMNLASLNNNNNKFNV